MKIPPSIVLGLLLFVAAYNWNEPSRVSAASEQQSTNENTKAQQREREDAVKSIEAKFNEYDKKFDDLEARLSTVSGTDKEDFRKMIQQLRDQKKDIAAQFDSAKNASPDAWRLIKPDIDSRLAKLERSYQDASKKYELTPVTPPKNQEKSPPKNQQKSY